MMNENASSNNPRVKIVAVAKDEAAYLPDWIHHHLYLGFDFIDVYVNRTTDNSLQMLNFINKTYPQVRGISADWIDTCPQEAQSNLQYIVYAKAFEEAKVNDEADYILFLDIDEFWTPKSLRKSIQECIAENPHADTISFEWINEFGRDDAFLPLAQQIQGRINPLVKTLIKITAPVLKHRFHMPELDSGNSVLVDGQPFVRDAQLREGLHRDLQHLRPVMIIHRAFRSPMEYISLLNRGRPSDELQIKLNRGGYNECAGREVLFELNKDGYDKYIESHSQFVQSMSFDEMLVKAREFVQSRYQRTLEYLPNVPRKYFLDLFRVFRGCTDKEYRQLTTAMMNSTRLKRCQDPDELVELAKGAEKIDVHVAHVIWKQALIYRSKGPQIKDKIKKYIEKYGES
ncbi:glycosyltransferase family 2 protein [Neptunicella sp. SCSIO 80796]|uniref:glycosyltransferase family 2 protein n=1 Tax=Neptunicella plasticusilytica TaxID=3117012 RepID=UPI003A4D6F82